jgi:mono/diheme cytochrome c family protein
MAVASVFTSLVNPFKFDRLADRVLADVPEAERGAARSEMRSAMWETLKEAVVFAWYNNSKVYPTLEGYGRTDGLARIANTVFADNLDRDNYRTGNAPVNYPHLWDIWGFDWVQWTGSVSQAMARNVNESLGVRARLELRHADTRFDSSALLPEMHCIETVMQHLTAPTWPEKLFGAVDRELAAEGQVLFNDVCHACHGPFRFNVAEARKLIDSGVDEDKIVPARPTRCVTCHGPLFAPPDRSSVPNNAVHLAAGDNDWSAGEKDTGGRVYRVQTERDEVWQMAHIYLDYVGTDPTSAMNFYTDTYDLSLLKDTPAGRAVTAPASGPTDKQYITDWEHVSGGVGLRFIGGEVRFQNYAKFGIWDPETRKAIDQVAVDDLNGFGELDRPRAWKTYRPRPLEGIWTTAPYLHNGSVPSLYQLLLPADERDTVFYLGRKEYDPVNLGLRTEKFKGAFKYDTRITGNSNFGHEFDDGLCGNGVIGYQREDKPGYCRQFTERERRALLEYLKIHSDEPRIDPGTLAHCEYVKWPEAPQ